MIGKLYRLALDTRRRGNSRLLLQIALINPQVILVFKDMHQAQEAEGRYLKIIRNLTQLEHFGEITLPKFVDVNYDFKQCNWPVMFDNSVLTIDE